MNEKQRKARIEKMRAAGRKGGQATKKNNLKKDPDYYKKLGSKGGKKSWEMESPEKA